MSRIKNSKLYIDQEVLLTREGINMDQEISLHRSISISETDGTALLHSVQELIPIVCGSLDAEEERKVARGK